MSDIAVRLRNHGYVPMTVGENWQYMTLPVGWVEEAADEIERLREPLEILLRMHENPIESLDEPHPVWDVVRSALGFKEPS